jgi:hypothetical protein
MLFIMSYMPMFEKMHMMLLQENVKQHGDLVKYFALMK